MRRLLSFDCDGGRLGATLDDGPGDTGVLMVTGGSQTRIGSHRMYERLAQRLAAADYPAFRFDRRGVGDSEGEDPGYRGSARDLAAAAAAFRGEVGRLRTLIGFGLCDGATALALFGDEAGVNGLVLVNPWLVEAEAGAPAPAAIRSHYRRRLTSREGWKKLLSGSISWRKLLAGLKESASGDASPLAQDVAAALRRSRLPVELILARDDATAVAAMHETRQHHYKGLIVGVQTISSPSHSFAAPGDPDRLFDAVLAALRRLEGRARP